MKLDSDPEIRRRFRAHAGVIAGVEFEGRPDDPTPHSYYRARLGPPGPERDAALDKYLRYYLDLFETAGRTPGGRIVLEVGSGFGLGLVAVATLGAAEANGVEIVPWQVEWACRARDTLPEELRTRVKPVVGNATTLPYDDGTFDVVFSLEAISHYLEYEPFLDEAHRVLRPGGVLVISDGNNGLNRRIRRYTETRWAEHEADPTTQPVERPDSPWLFVPKRERIVAETIRRCHPRSCTTSRCAPRGWCGRRSRTRSEPTRAPERFRSRAGAPER